MKLAVITIFFAQIICCPAVLGKTNVRKKQIKITAKPIIFKKHFFASLLPQKSTVLPFTVNKYSSYSIKMILPNYSSYKKGDLLYQLTASDLIKTIARKQRSLAKAEMALALANLKYKQYLQDETKSKQRIELAYQAKEKQYAHSNQLLQLSKQEITMQKKWAKHKLASVKREYSELKKLYEADKLIENTEEIILERQALVVEQAEKNYQKKLVTIDYEEKVTIPQKTRAIKEQLVAAKKVYAMQLLTWQQQKVRLAHAVAAAQEIVEATKNKLKDLTLAKQQLSYKASSAGILVYGKRNQEKWFNVAKYAVATKKIKQPFTVSLVPKDSKPCVIFKLPAYLLPYLDNKEASLLAFFNKTPTQRFPLTVLKKSPVKQDKEVEEITANSLQILANNYGEKLSIVYQLETKKKYIQLPTQVIRYQKVDGKPYVQVLQSSGKTAPQVVELGEVFNKHVVIKKGLEEGQIIVVK